jgi:hypothetical protein
VVTCRTNELATYCIMMNELATYCTIMNELATYCIIMNELVTCRMHHSSLWMNWRPDQNFSSASLDQLPCHNSGDYSSSLAKSRHPECGSVDGQRV